jgi:flagellar biosynthesis protein FliP
MTDAIAAALISAAASIGVAFVSRQTAQRRDSRARTLPGTRFPTRTWTISSLILAVWLLVSPGAIHHDFSGTNYFVIPVVLLLLALLSPIRPLTALWVSLAVFSANFVLGPLGNRMVGSAYDTQFFFEP